MKIHNLLKTFTSLTATLSAGIFLASCDNYIELIKSVNTDWVPPTEFRFIKWYSENGSEEAVLTCIKNVILISVSRSGSSLRFLEGKDDWGNITDANNQIYKANWIGGEKALLKTIDNRFELSYKYGDIYLEDKKNKTALRCYQQKS